MPPSKWFSAAHLLRAIWNCGKIFDFFKNHFGTKEAPGTNLPHSFALPCKLLWISDHNSLIYSICCKFFTLVPICCIRLQQPLFFIFKNFPHFFPLKPWFKIQHPWTLNIFIFFHEEHCKTKTTITTTISSFVCEKNLRVESRSIKRGKFFP